MKTKGWIRLVVLLSLAWIVGVSGLAMYEMFTWAPTGHNLDGKQIFFYYYVDPDIHEGFIPITKDFNEKRYFRLLIWPLLTIWIVYGFIDYGARWVIKGFKKKST